MGIFDNILICSDYDNTLTFEEVFCDENVEAIQYFRKNGGTFVIITGRGYNGTEYFNPVLKEDGYLVVNNGTVLYKYDKAIEKIPLDDEPIKIAKSVLKNKDFISSFGVYWIEGTIRYYTDESSFQLEKIDMKNATKLSFFCDTQEHADILAENAINEFGNCCTISKSLPKSFEIYSSSGGKGKMALELKKMLGKKVLVCMGDYDTDISMLKVADISIAPSNATENVKKVVNHIITNSKHGIMQKVIEILK